MEVATYAMSSVYLSLNGSGHNKTRVAIVIYKPLQQLILILIYLAFIAEARSRRVFLEWEQ